MRLDFRDMYTVETIITIYAVNIPINAKSVLSPNLFIIICICVRTPNIRSTLLANA